MSLIHCLRPQKPVYIDDIVFKVESIQAIPQAPSYSVHRGKPTRCVWLPRYNEARLLLDKFIANVGYIHHVTHHPSLPSVIDDVYRQIGSQEPIKPGHLVLLLSIIASTTHVWTSLDDEGSLFESSTQANAQTPLWIKATHDVLNAVQDGPALALETIQGIIILSFIICNLEGVSLRYRSLISTGLLLGREIGLHRIDHESNSAPANTLQAEVGRRVWWYLIATDWLLAVRHGSPGEGVYQSHPRQMMVQKPRNINDLDLLNNNKLPIDLPISQPTEMSYFLQRIRIAEISRNIVDRNPMSAGGANYHTHVMAMDFELDHLIHDIPSFFHLEQYDHNPDSQTDIFIQAYLLNSIIHTQRCKLHLTYLTSGPNNNPTYASSRDACLNSARQIIRTEIYLERTGHPFVLIRQRLSGLLYGVFMATIVLLMDACIHGSGSGSLQNEIRHGEIAEALRIVDDARRYSFAAANLYDSLMQVLEKHRQAPVSASPQLGNAPVSATAPTINALPASMERSESVTLVSNTTSVSTRGEPMSGSPDQTSVANGQPLYYNPLAQGLEELMLLDGFQWDDLFSGIDASSFF
ncbi:hypothetical protein BO70DRAFT_336004 [Aspergillus heteromorphus CBS 117.55]|uniref:Transcription factor domain-containing protein n=1 Tax=Aspergillus heteromorphus CBS 117.55 TaxID=1448321 RepID=A0A317W9C1_9EURO|nr:uncharacterized protein BO70DRAFT_336004 [Aspergillus heteromorphus CBS 117.55]PWY82923.1 hypothetical protein BO70DRAFT_336004 [Aspergillus heteromorphus CBS 117.55]